MTRPFREARIDVSAIAHNTERMRRAAPTPHFMAVVKADGYGHGAVRAARAALEAGADHLGVADVAEALELRAAGIDAPVLAWLHDPLADLDAAGGPAAQWRISRLSAEVVRDAEALCVAAPKATSDEVFRAVLTCREEVVPQLQGQLDDLLHNHLLARAP